MRKKKYSMFLTAAMVLALGMTPVKSQASVPTTVNEKQFEDITPTYEIAGAIDSLFQITNNVAKLSISINAPASKKVSIKMVLQMKSGGSWIKVQKWTKEGMGTQILTKSTTVTKGKTYRMKCVVNVGAEEIIKKTPAKTA